MRSTPHLHEHVLNQIFGHGLVPQHSVGHGEEQPGVAVVQRGQRLDLAARGLADDGEVVQLGKRGGGRAHARGTPP